MRRWLVGSALGLGVGWFACAGGGSTGTADPLVDERGTPAPPPEQGTGTAVMTLSADGVFPSRITVTAGSHLTFMNRDDVPRELMSNPHPAHAECLELNVGRLEPDQSRTIKVSTTAIDCAFHDDRAPEDSRYHGAVKILPSADEGHVEGGGGWGGGFGGGAGGGSGGGW